MVWCQTGDKPLPKAMLIQFTHVSKHQRASTSPARWQIWAIFLNWIHPSHKSHNAWDQYPTMHHSITEMCPHRCMHNIIIWMYKAQTTSITTMVPFFLLENGASNTLQEQKHYHQENVFLGNTEISSLFPTPFILTLDMLNCFKDNKRCIPISCNILDFF